MPLNPKLQQLLQLGKRVTRPIVRKGWWHWVRFALLLAAGSYLGHILSESPRFSDIRYELYQKQVELQHREAVYPQHTILVLLDDDDYWSDEYQARAPTKRDKIASLLDRLNEAGANTVGIDLDFSSPIPSQPDHDFSDYVKEDELLFASMKRMCDAGRHVVLTTFLLGERPPLHQAPAIYRSRLASLPCVTVGHDGFPGDMRKIAGRFELDTGALIDSFSLTIVKIIDPVAYHNLVKGENKGFRFGRYLTPEDFAPKDGQRFVYNGKAIEALQTLELRQAIANRAVIIGESHNEFAYGQGGLADSHNSPGGWEPGAMIHANYVEAELNPDSTFVPISDETAEYVEWSLAFLLALVGALEIPALWKWGSVGLCFLFSLLLTYTLMQNLGLFLDFFVPFLMIVVHTLTEELLEMRRELKHARHLLKEHSK
jgi:CHASE2 domain-containing sensor protein